MRLDKDEKVEETFKKRRTTISLSYISLYETPAVYYGPDWQSNPEAKEFTMSILKKLKNEAETIGVTKSVITSVCIQHQTKA